MKPKTKSELMAEWAGQPDQLKREREVKAIRKAMDDARAVMQDSLTRYVKKKTKARRKGSDKYTDLVTEMLETAIRRVGSEYADMLFEYDQQRREAEKQCEQLAMEGMMKK